MNCRVSYQIVPKLDVQRLRSCSSSAEDIIEYLPSQVDAYGLWCLCSCLYDFWGQPAVVEPIGFILKGRVRSHSFFEAVGSAGGSSARGWRGPRSKNTIVIQESSWETVDGRASHGVWVKANKRSRSHSMNWAQLSRYNEKTRVSMQAKRDNRPKGDYSASVCCPSRPKSARRICKRDR